MSEEPAENASGAGEGVVDTQAAAPPVAAGAPEAAALPAPEGEGGQPRGPDGKFLSKDGAPTSAAPPPAADAAAPVSEPAKPQAGGPPSEETTSVPHSLPAPLKAAWASLPKEWQTAFLKQEDSVKTAKDEWAPKAQRLNRWDEILAPRRERLQLAGMDEFQAVQTLFAAQDLLERDAPTALRYLARSYGVDLSQLAPQTSPTGAAPAPAEPGHAPAPPVAPQTDPALQALFQEVSTLKQTLTAREQAEASRHLSDAQAAVAKFEADPKNLYFSNVRQDVAELLRSGRAETLEQAYEQACWANPEIRQLLITEQTQAARRSADEAVARQKAEAAQRASGSVTGAPTPGARPPSGPVGTVRESLLAAMQEHGTAV